MGRVYAIASGKGGVGKTTTVANLGAVLAAGGYETAVVDADLGMGNLAGVLGVDADAKPTINDVLAGTAEAADAIRPGPAGLSVLPASADLDDFASADPSHLAALLEAIDASVVLLDTSAGLSHDSVEPLRVADEVLLVSTAERGALSDTAKTREVAARFDTPVAGVVVTRAVLETDDGGSADARTVADRLGVPVRGTVPEDPAVSAAAETGDPLLAAAPDAPATDAYCRLAADLLDDPSLAPSADEAGDEGTERSDTPSTGERDDGAASGEADRHSPRGADSSATGEASARDATDEGPTSDPDATDDGEERTGFLRWLLR
jgi:septum site-determining protein MinD